VCICVCTYLTEKLLCYFLFLRRRHWQRQIEGETERERKEDSRNGFLVESSACCWRVFVFVFRLCKCLDFVLRRSLQDGLHSPDLEGSSTAHVSVFADLSRHNSDCQHCYPGLISKASRRHTSSSSARGQARGKNNTRHRSEHDWKETSDSETNFQRVTDRV
jgi:hypothetical protein